MKSLLVGAYRIRPEDIHVDVSGRMRYAPTDVVLLDNVYRIIRFYTVQAYDSLGFRLLVYPPKLMAERDGVFRSAVVPVKNNAFVIIVSVSVKFTDDQ